MAAFTARFGDRVQIIGDDYLVTNAAFVRAAAAEGACNAVLIKVNQAGTVSEAVEALMAADARASARSSRPARAKARTCRSAISPALGWAQAS